MQTESPMPSPQTIARKVKPEVCHSVCPHDCPSVCALDVSVGEEGRVGVLKGAPQPYTAGVICDKVRKYADRLYHPERLLYPLRRVGAKGEGRFERISWEEALETVARRFQAVTDEFGSEAVWPYSYGGTMGHLQRNRMELLRHALRYSRQKGTICVALASAGYNAGMGARVGTDARELVDADVVVLWGCNAVYSQVQVMGQIAAARKKKGTAFRLVVVDPYRTPTAEKADLHLALRPGSDAALACAVMHVLFAEGMADRDWMARYTDDPVGLEAHLADKTPAWAAEITGLSEDEILAFARLYGQTRRSFLRLGYGFTRSRNGAVSMHAALCLPSVTGAWAVQGGGALYSSSSLFSLKKSLIDGSDVADSSVRSLDMCRIGAILTGDPQDLGKGPPVKAMLVQNTNPAVVAPDSAKVREGLRRDDLFLCVHEQFMTDTARYADIVLPATMFLEHEDVYTPGAHSFLQCHRAVTAPAGECRSNQQVIDALAQKLGVSHPGLGLSAWDLIDQTLRASGYPGADQLLEMRWLDCAPTGDQARFLTGFPTADGKFHFHVDWRAHGAKAESLPSWPDYAPIVDAATPQKPFRLITPPSRMFLNTTFTEMEANRQREKRPIARLHPQDMQSLGVADGDLIRLGNERGRVSVACQTAVGQQPGVVVVESVWPNRDFPEELGINSLTSAEAGYPNGGAVFHDTAVWIEPVTPELKGEVRK